MTPTEYEQRQQRIERLRRAEDTERGKLAAVLERLKTEFGVRSLADAEKLLARMEKEAEAASCKADAAEAGFNKKWGKKLLEMGVDI